MALEFKNSTFVHRCIVANLTSSGCVSIYKHTQFI